MYRIKKADGWNKYKVQERFMFIFWRNTSGIIYNSRDKAILACAMLIEGV